VSRDFEVAEFSEINTGGANIVIFRNSEHHMVTVEMHENLFEHIDMRVQNGTLSVGFRGVSINHTTAPRIYVYTPYLEGLTLSGSASTEDWDDVFAENFSIRASGASRVDMYLDASYTDIRISGSSRVELRGSSVTADVRASGSSVVLAANFYTREAELHASGSSQINISVSQNLNVIASGSSHIRYAGSPVISQRISGAARVEEIVR